MHEAQKSRWFTSIWLSGAPCYATKCQGLERALIGGSILAPADQVLLALPYCLGDIKSLFLLSHWLCAHSFLSSHQPTSIGIDINPAIDWLPEWPGSSVFAQHIQQVSSADGLLYKHPSCWIVPRVEWLHNGHSSWLADAKIAVESEDDYIYHQSAGLHQSWGDYTICFN